MTLQVWKEQKAKNSNWNVIMELENIIFYSI